MEAQRHLYFALNTTLAATCAIAFGALAYGVSALMADEGAFRHIAVAALAVALAQCVNAIARELSWNVASSWESTGQLSRRAKAVGALAQLLYASFCAFAVVSGTQTAVAGWDWPLFAASALVGVRFKWDWLPRWLGSRRPAA
ncbi:hypothetical protein CKO28_18795 [Rhodovibrio sodomensis]|uniref:GtrA-like protein domain-containing protein n=1 Tax=Rhodovibrio sodomensis TaxID=1088 RepID=A0ABS1DJJ5_9PROT|nr:hypothetical protein [Rhodovibrio sodomensis]MBK1670087.1 hypothetical protein [Rhodovibrio sodomensis]